MPELPEAETVRRGLQGLIVGRAVKAVKVHDSPRSFPNALVDVQEFLVGSSVTAVRRRAKVLMIDLSTDYTLVTHLKMTGQLVFINKNLEGRHWKIEDGKAPNSNSQIPNAKNEVRFGAGHPTDSLVGHLPDRSTRVTITFDDNSNLFFNDQRKFGWMKLLPSLEVPNLDFMKKVGPEPLEESFVPQDFIQRIRRRNGTTIKAAILDQTVLAGVGNIYADESLWGAKIHPSTRVKDVGDDELEKLLEQIKYVMNLSIEKGGSTDRNYLNAEGQRGSYLEFANVFRREGQPCRRHPDVLIEKIRVAGRGTHVCPVCQEAGGDGDW